jgi:hypothetical protein
MATPQVRRTKRTPDNWHAAACDLQYWLRRLPKQRQTTAAAFGSHGMPHVRRGGLRRGLEAIQTCSSYLISLLPSKYKSTSLDCHIIKLRKI